MYSTVARSILLLSLATITTSRPSALPVVEANDNRTPAGILKNDTLTIHLVVRIATWYPEAPDGPHVDVATFSEEGKAPTIPGPLIRVREGTTIVASIRNELADSAVWMRGLVTRPASTIDSTAIPPGQTKTFAFNAGKPGTYFYYATPGVVNRTPTREREQLSGAFVVDAPGARREDRIFMINIWGETLEEGRYNNAVAINGKSWPYTERFAVDLGDSLHWRVINPSVRGHPMHLHGFYFQVNSSGSIIADTILKGDRREFAVTKHMVARSTMSMSWSPNRPGNWLFHCHFTPHVNEGARLGHMPEHGDVHSDADPMNHMAGLVIGITVSDPRHRYRPMTPLLPLRKLRLYAQDRPATATSPLATSYILQRDSRPPATDSMEKAGQVILLTRNQPTRVTIVNRAHAATSVHWHGIELESYNDGVAGWSGTPTNLAPMVAPHDSLTVNLILPRAGTFIYHTHLNDMEQITSGAYGPIVVLDPQERFDPATDHVLTIGWMGLGRLPNVRIALNGDSAPPPLVLQRGRTHRFRIVNIGAAGRFNFTLRQDSTIMAWRPVAKDGFELSYSARTLRPAVQLISTGETFEVEWTPPRKGEYLLTVINGGRLYNKMKLIVR